MYDVRTYNNLRQKALFSQVQDRMEKQSDSSREKKNTNLGHTRRKECRRGRGEGGVEK